MVVQHNLTAMNSNRMLGLTTGSQAKSTEKLSSGYKINRAADDAAGLSISEKMRKQIRGLTQATSNAQDGISAVQTAEGALNEVQDMLQRMNELAVKAANGTMSENDRSYVQNEVDQLVTEIDRVAETTKFNETYLLQGNVDGVTAAAQSVAFNGQNATIANGTAVKAGDIKLGTVTVADATGTAVDNGNVTSVDKTKLVGSSVGNNLDAAAGGAITLTYDDGTELFTSSQGTVTFNKQDLADSGIVLGTIADTETIVLTKDLTPNSAEVNDRKITYDADSVAAGDLGGNKLGTTINATIKVDADGVATLNAYDANYIPQALSLSLHVGADSTTNNKISVDIETMNAKGLGLKTPTGDALKVDGKDSTNADAAINTIADALQKVSTQRSALGAIQNRLEHTINNLGNVVENTTSAEAAIRDTDMATEMVKYANNNILAQAGTSMLAQANQANQTVLSLLG